ncbi:MAG: ketoacyl-ACP synthase III [Candidatus Omnitrophica bacterium]|nr:ketoacyl-ACP synthase III [Candidatus Omnitrophota bacterium]
MTIPVGILGLGTFLPDKRLTNADLEKMVETTDEWIISRTGIRERRLAGKGVPTSELAVEAARRALKDAGLTPADIGLIIVATISPDMIFPATACIVQYKLGAECPAYDISAACSGFPFAMSAAHSYVASGMYERVLVIGAEVLSAFIDWTDRSTCVLFGDGAGAAIIAPAENGRLIIDTQLGSSGKHADLLKLPAGGSAMRASEETVRERLHFLKMDGKEIFKLAVRYMGDAVLKLLKTHNLNLDDIRLLIPHQANLRIISAVADRVGMPMERVFVNVDKYGNMSSAASIVALAEAAQCGKIKSGDYVVLVAFGAGLTWSASLIKW